MEQSTFLEEIRFSEYPPQTEEKNKIIFEENQTDLLQPHIETHRGMMVKPNMIFGLFQEISFTVITWKSFPTLLKYIDVTRTTDTTSDVMSEKNIEDYWNVDGDRELSDSWTGFTRFIVLNEKAADGCTWSWKYLARKQTTSRPDSPWPEIRQDVSEASKRKKKQKWCIEKPKLDNARKLRGIFFIDLDDEEFKRMMKNARKKLEFPIPAAMPCRLQHRKHRETCFTVEQHKTKNACIVEADESLRIRMEGTLHIGHEDHVAGKGVNSMNHFNMVHNFSYASNSNENTRCRRSSG